MNRPYLVFALGFGQLGCGSDGGGAAVVDSQHVGEKASATITAADGGEVKLADAGITLRVPAGALSDDTKITAEVVSKIGLPQASTLVGDVVELGPSGLQFSMPVVLELSLGGAKVSESQKASIAYLDEEKDEWVDLDRSIVAGGKVSAGTTHFSMFAIRLVAGGGGTVQQAGGQCADTFDACGGTIEGTWTIVSGCATVEDLGGLQTQCPGASVELGVDITGDITFADGRVTGTIEVMSQSTQVIPKSCLGGMCPAPDESDPSATVYTEKGDACEAMEMSSETTMEDSAYAVDGSTLTVTKTAEDGTTSEEVSEFCIDGSSLVVRQTTTEGFTVEYHATKK